MKSRIKYYVFNKPYNVLSQFTREKGSESIADYFILDMKDIYPVGRLDRDSEGLLILTNDKDLNKLLLRPKEGKSKTYWAQVEGVFNKSAAKEIGEGVKITVDSKEYTTLPAKAQKIATPNRLWERNPPIRERKDIPTSWVEITIKEGKNRQVRKMLAKVGYPVLRLVRVAIEDLVLDQILPGDIQELDRFTIYKNLKLK